jgi:hypothetical protein
MGRHHTTVVSDPPLPEEEIKQRMEAGIRRALSTPPKPTKDLIGKTERAKAQQDTKTIRARRAKPKSGEAP